MDLSNMVVCVYYRGYCLLDDFSLLRINFLMKIAQKPLFAEAFLYILTYTEPYEKDYTISLIDYSWNAGHGLRTQKRFTQP